MYSWVWATLWAVLGIVFARDVFSLVTTTMMVTMHVRWAMQAMDLEEERGDHADQDLK
jgi:hypothetical protein